MKNKNTDTQTGHKKPRIFKIIKWIVIGTAGLVLLIFFGVPLYLSSSGGTHFLLGRINQSVDGQVQMDDFSMGWFKGVKLTNLSYADNTGNTSVKVRRVETQPKYISLLGGKVRLGKTLVEGPQIYLKVPQAAEQAAGGEALPAETKSSSARSASAFPLDQIDLKVIDGAATIELINGVSQKVQFANIASNVQIAESGKPSSVDISMDVDETSNLSAKGTLTPAKKGWTLKEGDFEVQVSKLQLASLKPLFALAGQEMDMAGELNADATIKVEKNRIQQLKADATISDFAQGSGDQRTVFDQPVKLSALLVGGTDTVKIENAVVQSSFCTVDCAGTLESLNYEISADLAQTQRFAGQFTDMKEMALQGTLAAKGKVMLTNERVGISGAGNITRLVAEKGGVRTPATDVQMNFDCTVDKAANQFQLASMNLAATPGTVDVSNLVLPMSAEAAKTVSLDAQAKLDLAKTWPFVQVFADLPKDVQLTGMLNSAVKVSTEGSTVRLLTDRTQVEQLKISRPDSQPFQQEKVSLSGDIILDTDNQTIDIQKLDMEAADGQSLIKISKGKVEKKVSRNTTELSGDFQAQYDLKTVSAFASAYLPQGLTMEGKRADTLHFESQYPTDKPELMKANLNASGTFGFEKASYFGLNFEKTDISLNIKKGVVDLNIPETVVNEGKLKFAGQLNLNEEPLMLRMDKPTQVIENIHLNDELTHKLLIYLNPVFAKQTNVSGFASLRCDQLVIPFSAEDKNQMAIDATVAMDKVRLKAVGFVGDVLSQTNNKSEFDAKLLPSRFVLSNGILEYNDMEFHLDEYPTGFTGRVFLDKRLDMKMAVPYRVDADSAKIRSVKVGEDLSERLELPIDGTVDDPQVRLEKLFDSVLEKIIQQQIQRGLGDILNKL